MSRPFFVRPLCSVRSLRLALLCTGVFASSAGAQMVSGTKIPGYAETFGVTLDTPRPAFAAQLVESSAPGNILWPEDKPSFTIQLTNTGGEAIKEKGKVEVIAYGTRGIPGDIWKPDMFRIAVTGSVPLEVDLAANAAVTVTVTPTIPAAFGAYALVADLGPHGRQFVTTCVRTFAASPERLRYPSFCLDMMPVAVLRRLGVQAVRFAIEYVPAAHPDYAKKMASVDAKLKELQANNIAVLLMINGGRASQPLGRPRPHLDANGMMLNTKSDMAWLPENDADFQAWVAKVAATYGWPKGPVNSFSLWNEPWEGMSISGWGADMLRYREIYTHMALGVEQARKDAGVEVLLGGCDSSSNTLDKFFGDGKMDFLKWLDFCSIHYQGLAAPSIYPEWVNRKSPYGRVRIWDTESWVANTDDRVAAVVAADRAAGYDRAMGVFHGNVCSEQKVVRLTADGKREPGSVTLAWPVAAAIGASQHFIGERAFRELLFHNGLPWIMVFDGLPGKDSKPNPDDGTLVVVGDLGEEFGAIDLPFRTARGLKEIAFKEETRRQLAALPAAAPAETRADLEAALAKYQVLSGATLTVTDAGAAFSLYDFYGNPVPAKDGKIIVPLDGRGFFLRASGAPGSFATLLAAVRASRIDGISPVAVQVHDMTARIEQAPVMRLTLTNVLNRPVAGALTVHLTGLETDGPAQVSLAPQETKDVPVKIVGGKAAASNSYHLRLEFDAGTDGKAIHEEDMHVNVIAKRTIVVDGKLDDWKDVLPQTVTADAGAGPSLTEAAWWPFAKFDASLSKGFANGYLAYDADFFYFAARIADDTPDDGMPRFETRNDDEEFYPEKSYLLDPANVLEKRDVVWAEKTDDVRALQKPGADAGRIAAAWETTVKSFAVDLDLPPTPPEGTLQQVAFYFFDWEEGAARRQLRLEVLDRASGKVLDKRDIRDFSGGRYAVYQLAGQVRVRITANNQRGATLSGIFFDSVPAPQKNPRAAAAPCRFVKMDDATQGGWQGVYGADGYTIVGAGEKLPAYAKIAVPKVRDVTELVWPTGVRRYSYRRRPELPSGNAPNHDNVQIAFNVIPIGQDGMLANPPGVMPGFTHYKDTDYEYALNPVAAKYGGGVEIWRLLVPGMPRKHFYPRQPKSPFDGPVKSGKLAIVRDGNTRIVEAALPWTELPEVKKALDGGQTIKFSFRVNDNGGQSCMELARERSVSKRNQYAFHVDWTQHWANELEFAFEK